MRAEIGVVELNAVAPDDVADHPCDFIEWLLRFQSNPSDARPPLIRKESASTQLRCEFRDAGKMRLDRRRELVDDRLLLFAEEYVRQVLRVGADPGCRWELRLHRGDAIVQITRHSLRKGSRDEKAHALFLAIGLMRQKLRRENLPDLLLG